ncbi:MAG: hypothetical protein ACTSVM_00885 [Candidatus Ranarchaeia archaeon]
MSSNFCLRVSREVAIATKVSHNITGEESLGKKILSKSAGETLDP